MARETENMSISLPSELKKMVKERVEKDHYGTPSDYLRSLIREDLKKRDQERIEQALLNGPQWSSMVLTQVGVSRMAQKNGTLSKKCHQENCTEEKVASMRASNLIFQREAEEDIAAIAAYIAGDSRAAAERFFAALDNLCELLMSTPSIESARIFQSPRLTETRMFPLKNFERYHDALARLLLFQAMTVL
ncbi:MAG TPA: type II toxin-antitoxin system RelE/ParE family toxin [Candidatus Paceibacterota bacterium]